MTIKMVFRATWIWLGIVFLAVVNGVIRENIVAPILGGGIALPISGLALSIIVFIVAYFSFSFIGSNGKSTCIYIGIHWVLLTLVFEFIFGHFVAGKSWPDLLQLFNMASGNLFLLVLLVCLFSLCAVAKIKGTS
jgi:hypothetical protein